MKKFDLIILKNERPYKKYNIKKDTHGIVIGETDCKYDIMFFNPNNVGDSVIAEISPDDIVVEKETLPDDLIFELSSKIDLIKSKAAEKIEPLPIKEYDIVELLVEKDNYSKFDVHKGDRGCVMSADAVQGYIEVDFSGIDKNGQFYGDCISVKVDDVKVVE